MKKIPTLFLTLSLLAMCAQAQIHVGICGGLNGSSYTLYTINSELKTGFHAGIFGELPLSKKIGIEADLQYSQKGGRNHDFAINSEYTYTVRLNYLTVPVLCNFRVTPRLILQAGPEIGWLLAARFQTDDHTSDIKGVYRSFNKGVVGGIFYQLPAGLGVGVRYIQGFRPITEELVFTDPQGNMLSSGSYGNNRTFQFTIHYTVSQRKG